ncbi:MAG: PIN domain-containing protein [Treponema sp.]|jgi:predicted nucleic acid-binding protein|nr:PIN domain-containing protein [Treponema sp.]
MKGMAVLLDTNVPLDSFFDREPFRENAQKILTLCRERKCKGFVAAHSLTNIFYILRKNWTTAKRKELLLDLCDIVQVAGIDRIKLVEALQNEDFDDIEDGLQVECAAAVNADYIITRDMRDFENSPIPGILPEDFLKLFDGE